MNFIINSTLFPRFPYFIFPYFIILLVWYIWLNYFYSNQQNISKKKYDQWFQDFQEFKESQSAFWQYLQTRYTDWRKINNLVDITPATLFLLTWRSQLPPIVSSQVCSKEKMLSGKDSIVMFYKNIPGNSALLWQFVQDIYPVKADGLPFHTVEEQKKDEFTQFNLQRECLYYFWIYTARLYFDYKELKEEDIRATIHNNDYLLKILIYLNYALTLNRDSIHINRDWIGELYRAMKLIDGSSR